MRPYRFVFPPKRYTEHPKISTRCFTAKAMDAISKLCEDDKRWFYEHPQFKHFFHMEQRDTRLCQGIWMLALRTVVTDVESQAWFVVNGVPIRYSIREHGLLSGLNCDHYPGDLESLGSNKFVKKHFPGSKDPTCAMVLEKMLKMKDGKDRLKMAVLYFLGSVIKHKSKENGPIDDFLIRVVDDLELCKTFPWGRLTYDDQIHQLYKMVHKFESGYTKSHCFSGFILPLEVNLIVFILILTGITCLTCVQVLAFECIDALKSKFREDVAAVGDDCPRLCRGQFKKLPQRGFSLEELGDALGDSKVIHSTIIFDGEVVPSLVPHELYTANPIVDGWNDIISRKGRIFWEDYYKMDVESRAELSASKEDEPVQQNLEGPSHTKPVNPPHSDIKELKEAIEVMKSGIEAGFKAMDTKMVDITAHVTDVKARLKEVEERVFKGAGTDQAADLGIEAGFKAMDMKMVDIGGHVTDVKARLKEVEERVFKGVGTDHAADLGIEAGFKAMDTKMVDIAEHVTDVKARLKEVEERVFKGAALGDGQEQAADGEDQAADLGDGQEHAADGEDQAKDEEGGKRPKRHSKHVSSPFKTYRRNTKRAKKN